MSALTILHFVLTFIGAFTLFQYAYKYLRLRLKPKLTEEQIYRDKVLRKIIQSMDLSIINRIKIDSTHIEFVDSDNPTKPYTIVPSEYVQELCDHYAKLGFNVEHITDSHPPYYIISWWGKEVEITKSISIKNKD